MGFNHFFIYIYYTAFKIVIFKTFPCERAGHTKSIVPAEHRLSVNFIFFWLPR